MGNAGPGALASVPAPMVGQNLAGADDADDLIAQRATGSNGDVDTGLGHTGIWRRSGLAPYPGMTEHPIPLKREVVYLTDDFTHIVCAECGGDRDTGGRILWPATADDVTTWAAMDVSPLTCDCGSLVATLGAGGRIAYRHVAGARR